jgi:hypothetical protein
LRIPTDPLLKNIYQIEITLGNNIPENMNICFLHANTCATVFIIVAVLNTFYAYKQNSSAAFYLTNKG